MVNAEQSTTRKRASSQSPVIVDSVTTLMKDDNSVRPSRSLVVKKSSFLAASTDADSDAPRPISSSSSLDPYYFMISSRNQSPVPPIPDNSAVSETQLKAAPITPLKEQSIPDRRNLIGVGELATPRWMQTADTSPSFNDSDTPENNGVDSYDTLEIFIERDDAGSDSPWTIEAIDGDLEEQEEGYVGRVDSSTSHHNALIEESGGEEILYPRQTISADTAQHARLKYISTSESVSLKGSTVHSDRSSLSRAKSQTHRTAEVPNFEAPAATEERKDRSAAPVPRVERAIASEFNALATSSGGDQSLEEGQMIHTENQSKFHMSSPFSGDAHLDADTNLQKPDGRHPAGHNESSTITNRSFDSGSSFDFTHGKERQRSSSVAHSLLKGTQEGWSIDDDATAEALRKLDGVSGRTARARGSIGNMSRSSSHSRPATPSASKGGVHRDTAPIDPNDRSYRSSLGGTARDSQRPSSSKGRGERESNVVFGTKGRSLETDILNGTAEISGSSTGSGDDVHGLVSVQEKVARKSGATSARSSFTPKRGSASSTLYTTTPTTSSRDSEAYSIGTSATSMSAASGRFSIGKLRRNSAGSDVSSINSSDALMHKDRPTTHNDSETEQVPPVPPLPKDLSSYKSSSQVGNVINFSTSEIFEDLDVVPSPPSSNRNASHGFELRKPQSNSQLSIQKSPSKKWSFSSALSLKRSSSPSPKEALNAISRTSPANLSIESGQRSGAANTSTKSLKSPITDRRPVTQAGKLTLISTTSAASLVEPAHPVSPRVPKNWEHERNIPSRSETSSTSTSQANMYSKAHRGSPSPLRSDRRDSSKRLTPSAIPFFKRSSSHSIHLSNSANSATASSPTISSTSSPSTHLSVNSHSTPKSIMTVTPNPVSSTTKKSSVLSLGIPALLKSSSSRRSLQADKSELSMREISSREKEKTKKEDKDRSESRISVLMGRRRGKTLSATDPKKVAPIMLPPMQMSAIPQTTAQRLANLQSANVPSSGVTLTRSATTAASSRATSQTISSMQKQTELRSSRQQLPTIAGSPSIGSAASRSQTAPRLPRDHSGSSGPQITQTFAEPNGSKETPTKIPRISSRSSTVTSPVLKSSSSLISASRRTSLNGAPLSSLDPSYQNDDASTDEFGVLDTKETSSSRISRQTMATLSSTTLRDQTSHKIPRESLSFAGLRKVSSGSIASEISQSGESNHRFSALSPSKGLNKFLAPKGSLNTTRIPNSLPFANNVHQVLSSPSSSRLSMSTPSPVPSPVDEDEVLGDEEMMQYIKRLQARKLANGAKKEDLEEMLRFPEPQPRGHPVSPNVILESEQAQYLSDYERKEILDHPLVYFIGAKSEKNMASRDTSTNNFGYDDERGDYLVVPHDHLAYRYEIITTLGKGSFGQVLHCRDHCTGESVAVKIIRNKKRFHKQAEVEIKILESLSKWDPEEKHNVIKMTEHFSFRDHLCIAMELLSINLYELIKANGFSGFTTTLIRRFASQMLMSLSLMRHHRIVHCDLKPENVLLKHPAKSGIKVIDFGSSCFEHEKVYTYIQSRFYRSPEVILGMNYHMAIDMWSLGCILAELYTGFPIFPGENEQEQLSCIMEVLGVPDKELLSKSTRKKWFFDSTGTPRPVVNSKGRRRRPGTKSLTSVLHCEDENFVDFIAKCLIWDPERRVKPQTALRHPFFTAGRKSSPSATASSRTLLSSSSFGAGHRSKIPPETPKKSQISAPTPLTARSARAHAPSTPTGAGAISSTISSSRSHRNTQITSSSHRHTAHRPLNGYLTTTSTR